MGVKFIRWGGPPCPPLVAAETAALRDGRPTPLPPTPSHQGRGSYEAQNLVSYSRDMILSPSCKILLSMSLILFNYWQASVNTSKVWETVFSQLR